ncbi:MAG: mycofactocin system FadH/OYE family oxidoreductase 2, partial [Chloroflexi bacterium]|nr:mycofactocin system FadH/OYE family oxidoreductase 2 [Chloroflexota bacterium]
MSQPSFPFLFSPLRVGRATVRNRIVVTAHGKGYALDGLPNARMAAYYAERARGGVGLVVTEATVVHPTGRHRPGVVLGYEPASVPGFRRIAQVVHEHGALVVGQLFHPGLVAAGQLSLLPVWSSSRQLGGGSEYTHALDRDEIRELIRGFATTAAHMRQAGYDGVEVHAGHGYLLQQFISPLFNRRSDEYGGSLEKRLRLCVEVVDAVRAAIGPQSVVGLRLSAHEFADGGLTPDDAAEIAQRLEATGQLDYISVSAGNRASYWAVIPPMDLPPAVFTPFAQTVKQRIRLPVVACGRINDPAVAEEVLAAGRADLVGMTRALLADPALPLKAQSGRADEIRRCIACLQACRGTTIGKPVTCVVNPAAGEEERRSVWQHRPAARCK